MALVGHGDVSGRPLENINKSLLAAVLTPPGRVVSCPPGLLRGGRETPLATEAKEEGNGTDLGKRGCQN